MTECRLESPLQSYLDRPHQVLQIGEDMGIRLVSVPCDQLPVNSDVELPVIARDKLDANSVLAMPGTPCSNKCPPVNREINMRSTTTSWPTTTRATYSRTDWMN